MHYFFLENYYVVAILESGPSQKSTIISEDH